MILASDVLEFCRCKYTYAQRSLKFSAHSIKINAHIAMVICLAEMLSPPENLLLCFVVWGKMLHHGLVLMPLPFCLLMLAS